MDTGDEAENPTDDEQNNEEEEGSEELPGDNDTPVIETPDEEPVEDPVEDPAEEVVDPTTDPTLDPTYTIDTDATPQAAELAAPVITLKQGDNSIDSGAKVPNGAANVTFEIKAADGTEGTPEFYYNIDGTANPTNENGEKYENAVSVTAPTETTEKTVTIKAIAYIPASGEGDVAAQTSAVATATVVFQEKGKNISLSGESETATIKIGETTLSADASYEIADTESDLYVEVTAIGDNANRLFEVMYKDGPDTSSATWTSANEETSGDNKGKYMIPKARLTKDLVLKVVYMREITLDWQGDANWGSIGITATATRAGSNQNKVIFGDRLKDEKPELKNKVLAPKDTKVTLSIYPVTGAKITLDEVTLKEGEKEAQAQTIRSNKANFTVTDSIAVDYTVTIKGTGSYQGAVLEDSKGSEVSAVSGKYSVEPRNTYKLSAKKAGGDQYDIGAVKVLEGNKDVTSDSNIVILTDNKKTVADGEDGTETQAEVPDGTWNLALKEGAGGKNLKVMLYANEGDAKEVGFINLVVTPVISGVTVAKATGTDKDTIKQIVGTEGRYALTLNAKEKTSKDVLAAVVKDGTNTTNFIKSVEITAGNKELVITTNAVAVTDSAVEVEIKNTNNDEATAVIKTIKVVPDKPAWGVGTDGKGGAAPTVKLAGSTDIELTLDMTLPNGARENVDGATYYYKVTTKAADTTEKDYTANEQPRYYPASGKTTHENIKVIAQKFGEGRSEKFSARVELVLYKNPGDSTTPPTGGDDNEGSGGGTEGGGETGTASYTGASVNAAADETGGDTGDGGDGEGGTTPGQPETPDTSDKAHTATPDSKGYTLIATSKAVTLNNLATKTRYYADKIILKKEKAASGIYTGQTAAVATVDFGKNTTYNRDQDVKAWVKEFKDVTGNEDEIIKVRETDSLTVKDGKVTLIVGKNVKPGKYTLCVEQTAGLDQGIPEGSVQASATMPITVVQGIKDIEASSASTIYVQANKPGTAKITTVYNEGIAADKPKTAKVTYEIGKVETGSFTEVKDYAAKVSVKNGTVTVAKGYASGDIEGNKFAVNVKAADFEDNETATYVEYEIVTEPQKLGNIVLVQKEATSTAAEGDEDASTYKVLAATNGKIEIPADQAKDTYVRILAGEKTETTGLKESDFVKAGLYTLTFSKKNDVSVNADQALVAKKVVSDVTVKALTTDGGKQKAANDGKLKFSIDYETVAKENVKLQIATDNTYADFGASDTTAVTTPTGAQIKVKAVETVDGASKDLSPRLVDYKVTVDGGATIVNNNGNKDNLDITLVMKKNKAVLTLKNQKNVKIADYTITNDNFSKLKAAPVVSVAKNSKKLYAKYEAEQTLEFTVAKWDTNKICDNTAVTKIKVTAAADKDSQALYDLIKSDSKEQKFTPTANGTSTFTIEFESMANADAIKKATLYFDFVDDNGAVQTLTTKGTVVKSELLKKSYKLTNKYSMSVKDAAKVTLTASGKPVGVAKKADSDALDVTFTKILNANIKGEVNHFTEAFELKDTDSQLILKDPDMAVKDWGKGGKNKGINNLIGFVVYTVNYEDGTEDTFTTQLTITIDAKKPAINGLKTTTQPVLAATDMAPEFSVITNKKAPVKLVAATFAGKNGGEIFAVDKVDTDNGIVTLKLKGENPTAPTTYKKLDGTLTVLPADSYYVKSYTEAQDESAKTKILEENGVALAVKIDVKDPAKTTKLVKVDSKQAKVSFVETKVNDEGKYTEKATYTVAVSASVKAIENGAPDKNNKPTCPNWITFSKGEGKNEISIVIDQKVYAAAVKGDGTQLNAKKNNYKDAGKAVKAVAVVSYNGSEKTDSLTFTITPPTMTKDEIDAAAGEAPAPGETITVTVTPATANVKKGENATFTASVTGSTDQNPSVTWKVEAAQDGGTMTQSTTIDANGKLAVDANETATKLTVTATYTDASNVEHTGTATVNVEEAGTQTPTE